MPKAPSLCDDFYQWARPKLRPLREARAQDKKAGVRRYGAFHTLREQYLSELEQLPFGHVDFHAYLDEDGERTLFQEEIRDRAAWWLRNHSRASGTVQLTKFESTGGVSESSASRVTSAAEMWAEGEKARIRQATCEALGIPVTTGNKALPSEWIGMRKSVVKREFASLPQVDQDEWNALASRERDEAAKDRGSVITIQERQKGFPAWLDGSVSKQSKNRGLGDVFVFQFSGYFVRAEDKQLERFRGQVSSDPTAAKWFQSEAYAEVVGPAWTNFIHKDVGDRLLFKLNRPPVGLTGEALDARRGELAQYFEELFRIECDFATLNEEAFWKAVKADPAKFVDPGRLPDGIVFRDPMDMLDDDFQAVYRHVWRCQNKPDTIDREARFIYEPEGVCDFVLRERMHHLRKQQKRRARNNAGDADGATAGDAGGATAEPAAQTSDAAGRQTTPSLDADAEAPRPTEEGGPRESVAPTPPQDDVVDRANANAPRPTTPATPRATLSGEDAEDAPGAQPRAAPASASTTPRSPSTGKGAVTEAPSGQRKALTRADKRRGAKADSAPAVPAVPKGRGKVTADKDETDSDDENEADPTPPKAQTAKAAPRGRKRKVGGGNKGEEAREDEDTPPAKKTKAAPRSRKRSRADEGEEAREDEDMPPAKKTKAAPRTRKRLPAADDDDEEYVAGASPPPKSKTSGASQNKKAAVDPKPAAGKPRYATRRREKK